MAAISIEAPFDLGAQIEARANHAELADRPFLRHGERVWTYRRYRDESVRLAHFLLRRLGHIDEGRPGYVAMMLENHLELLSLYGACGYAGLTLFGVNTGLRGETLAGVINQSRARVLVIDQRLQDEVQKVRAQLRHVQPENILFLRTSPEGELAGLDLMENVAGDVGPVEKSLAAPSVK